MSIDDLCEYAINFLLAGHGSARQLAVNLAERIPENPPLELVFILSITASGIEETFAGEGTAGLAADSWRIAALLGVDLYMMQNQGHAHAKCRDLLTYWQTVDRYFIS